MYAIINFGSKQNRVEKGSRIHVDLIQNKVGETVVTDRVLMVQNGGAAVVGQPFVANAKVTMQVIRHFRGEKKLAYKFRRRKNSQMKKGHRSELTELEIKEIKHGA